MPQRILTILFLALTLSTQTKAWNATTHQLIAAITYDQLSPEKREAMTDLLKSHPAYPKWADKYKELEPKIPLGKYLMMQASIWPDQIRGRNNPKASLDPKYHPALGSGPWHYINHRVEFPDKHDTTMPDPDKTPNVVWAINHTHEQIQDTTNDKTLRAMYLAWLIHIVGDVHQPLHCVALFNDPYAEKGDRGGNDFYVKPKNSPVNLHRLWDGALGREENPDKINNMAVRLRVSYPTSDGDFVFDAEGWSKEGHRNAIEYVYLNGELEGSDRKEGAQRVPRRYGKKMKRLAEGLVVVAGERLADLLMDSK